MKAVYNLLTISSILASVNCLALHANDFDGDGKVDPFSIIKNIDDAQLSINSSKIATSKNFKIPIRGDCGQINIFPQINGAGFFVDQSCPGRQGQISRESYLWSEDLKTWIFDKIIQGESIDPASGNLPVLIIDHAECCTPIDQRNSLKTQSKETASLEINRKLTKTASIFSDKALLAEALKEWDEYSASDLGKLITQKNLANANDLAYYLQQNKKPLEASIILSSITQNFPERTVAYLNLGDALWDLNSPGFQEASRKYYKIYSEKMKSSGKQNNIPKRVEERTQ